MRAGLRTAAWATVCGALALLFCAPPPYRVFAGYENAVIKGGSLMIALAERQPRICFDNHLQIDAGNGFEESDLMRLLRKELPRALKATTPFTPVQLAAKPIVNPTWRPYRMRPARMQCDESELSGGALVQRLYTGPAFVVQYDSITHSIPADSTLFKLDSITPDYFLFLQNLSILLGSSEDQTSYSPPARTTTGYYGDELAQYRPPRTVIYCSASFLLWDNRRQKPACIGFAEGRAGQDHFTSVYGSGMPSVDGQDPFRTEELFRQAVESFARKVADRLPLRRNR